MELCWNIFIIFYTQNLIILEMINSYTMPDGTKFSYVYDDANGNLLEQADARGNLITYTYDAINQLLTNNLVSERRD